MAYEWFTHAAPFLEPLSHFRPLVLAVVMMLLAVAFFSHPRLGRRLPREAVIGAVYIGAIGLTLLIRSGVAAHAEHEMRALTGNIIGVESLELTELLVGALTVGLIQAAFYKEFLLVSFDPEVARTVGFRASRWELLWYLNLGVMISISIHVAGTVLVFAYLVLPAVSALRLSRHMGRVLALSVVIGVLATVAGVLLSVTFTNLPTSPTIIVCLSAVALLTRLPVLRPRAA